MRHGSERLAWHRFNDTQTILATNSGKKLAKVIEFPTRKVAATKIPKLALAA